MCLGAAFKWKRPLGRCAEMVADAAAGQLPGRPVTGRLPVANRKWRAIGGHLPTLDAWVGYSKNTGCTFTIWRRYTKHFGWLANSTCAVPGRCDPIKWREAEANLEKAKQELENTRRMSNCKPVRPYLGVVSGFEQVQAWQQALKSVKVCWKPASWAGSGRAHQSGCAQCAAAAVFDAPRLIPGSIQLPGESPALKAATATWPMADLDRVNQALHD